MGRTKRDVIAGRQKITDPGELWRYRDRSARRTGKGMLAQEANRTERIYLSDDDPMYHYGRQKRRVQRHRSDQAFRRDLAHGMHD